MTHIIAINNHKGGVAKTTTCLSLGACLAELGRSVLLIDLDPQAHLTMSLGINPETLRRSVADALLANASLVAVSRESHILGLDVAPAGHDLALIDKVLYRQRDFEYRLKRQLATLQDSLYDYVLLDCSPALGTLTLNAITAADRLIIPIQAEYYAARSLRQIVRLVRLVRQKTNPALTYQVLVTMYDQRNKISRILLENLQRDLNGLLYRTIIGIDTRLRECPVHGQPITTYAPKTRAARQYRALAQEVVQNER